MRRRQDFLRNSCIFRVFSRVFSLPIPLPFRPGVPGVDPINVRVSVYVSMYCKCVYLYISMMNDDAAADDDE